MNEELNEIVLEGNIYISVKRAAELTKYTPDYIGQLCRGGKIDATRIGRNWYVRESSVLEHKGQYSVSDTTPPVPENKTVREGEKTSGPVPRVQRRQSIFKSGFIMYHPDDSPLLPSLRTNISDEKEVIQEVVMEAESNLSTEEVEASAQTTQTTQIQRRTPEFVAFFRSLITLRRSAFAIAFVLIFALSFSLNGGYAVSIIANNIGSVAAHAGSTKFGQTVSEDILSPFEYAAREFHDTVDETLYDFLYKDVVYEE